MTTSETRSSYDLDAIHTLPGLFENSLKLYSSQEAIRQFDRATNQWVSYSYKELGNKILAWRKSFAQKGLARGTHVAILMPN